MTEDPLPEEEPNNALPNDPPLMASSPSLLPLPPRRLRRRVNGSIGGVASGTADYLSIDPVIVRLAFVILAIVGSGGGILLYLAGWLLLPDQADRDPRPVALNDNLLAVIFGGLTLLAAVSATFGSITLGLDENLVVPLLFAAVGFYLLNQRAENKASLSVPGAAPAPPADPRFGPAAEQTTPFVAASVGSAQTPAFTPEQVPPSTWNPPPSSSFPSSEPTHWATPVVATTPVETGPKPPVTSVTLAVAAVVVGIILAVDQLADLDVGAASVFGAFAAICGFGLIASAFIGRARPLIPIGLIALLGLGLAPVVDTGLGGGFGPREYFVTSLDELQPTYEVGGGYLDLDLRRLELTEDRTVEVNVGGGYAEIVVPLEFNVIVEAESSAGYVQVFGREQAGVNATIERSADGTSDIDGGPTLTVKATVTFGYVEVRRG